MKFFLGMVAAYVFMVFPLHVSAQDDAKKEVLHARAVLQVAKEDYFGDNKPYVQGLHDMQNIVQGLREWVATHERGKPFFAEYQKRRNELRVTAVAHDIPEEAPFLTERHKVHLAAISVLTAHANESLFELLRLMGEIDTAEAEKNR